MTYQDNLMELYNKDTLHFFSRYMDKNMPLEIHVLLHSDPEQFISNCNGVGSPSGGWIHRLLYHLTPNTIWGMDISADADIHDNGYTVPAVFKTLADALSYKKLNDTYFYTNIKAEIYRRGGFLKYLRMGILNSEEFALQRFGDDAFFNNKIIKETT